MKFTVTMKDPDTLGDAVLDAVKEDVAKLGLSDAIEIEALEEARTGKVRELCSRWFRFGEYLTVEIDTDAGTATVLAVRG